MKFLDLCGLLIRKVCNYSSVGQVLVSTLFPLNKLMPAYFSFHFVAKQIIYKDTVLTEMNVLLL